MIHLPSRHASPTRVTTRRSDVLWQGAARVQYSIGRMSKEQLVLLFHAHRLLVPVVTTARRRKRTVKTMCEELEQSRM